MSDLDTKFAKQVNSYEDYSEVRLKKLVEKGLLTQEQVEMLKTGEYHHVIRKKTFVKDGADGEEMKRKSALYGKTFRHPILQMTGTEMIDGFILYANYIKSHAPVLECIDPVKDLGIKGSVESKPKYVKSIFNKDGKASHRWAKLAAIKDHCYMTGKGWGEYRPMGGIINDVSLITGYGKSVVREVYEAIEEVLADDLVSRGVCNVFCFGRLETTRHKRNSNSLQAMSYLVTSDGNKVYLPGEGTVFSEVDRVAFRVSSSLRDFINKIGRYRINQRRKEFGLPVVNNITKVREERIKKEKEKKDDEGDNS